MSDYSLQYHSHLLKISINAKIILTLQQRIYIVQCYVNRIIENFSQLVTLLTLRRNVHVFLMQTIHTHKKTLCTQLKKVMKPIDYYFVLSSCRNILKNEILILYFQTRQLLLQMMLAPSILSLSVYRKSKPLDQLQTTVLS